MDNCSYKNGLKTIVRGLIEIAFAFNHTVHRFPWECIMALMIMSTLTSAFWMAQCKVKQTTAEHERDSVILVLDNIKKAYQK